LFDPFLHDDVVVCGAAVAVQSVAWSLAGALVSLGTPWLGSRLKSLFALWKEYLVRRNKDCRPAAIHEWVSVSVFISMGSGGQRGGCT
jgi:hypothetical protein